MSTVRGEKPSDFDFDPQEYIDKAVKKYAGNTFILPNMEESTDDGNSAGPAHKTFFIPRDVKQRNKAQLIDEDDWFLTI